MIEFVAGTTKGTTAAPGRTGNGSLVVNFPSGYTPTAGHLALIIFYHDGGTATLFTQGAWAQVSGSPWGSGTPKLQAFWAVLEGGEGDPAFTISGSGTNLSHCANMAIYSGVDTGSPFDAIGSPSDGTGTPMTAGSVDTVTANAVALGLCGRGDNEDASGQTFGGSSTGVVERLDAGTGAGNDSQVSMYDKTIASAGATGNGSATTSSTDPWVSVIIALKPVGGSALTKDLSDTLLLADSKNLGENKTLSDTLNLADSRTLDGSKALTEALLLLDQLNLGSDKALSESLKLLDDRQLAITRVLLETMVLADAINKDTGKIVSESLMMLDSVENVVLLALTLTEVLRLSDSIARATQKLLAELLLIVDSVAKSPAKEFVEVLRAIDALGKSPELVRAEQIVLSDDLSKAITIQKSEILRVDDILEKSAAKTLTDLLVYLDAVGSQFIELIGIVRLLSGIVRVSVLTSLLFETSRLDVVALARLSALQVATIVLSSVEGPTLTTSVVTDVDIIM